MRDPIPEVADVFNFKSIKKRSLTELEEELKPFQKLVFKSLLCYSLNIALPHPNPDLGDHILKNFFLLFKFVLRDEDFEECAVHTNLNADRQNAQGYFKIIPHKNGRHWQPVCRGEMKIFIRIFEYMGLYGMQGEIEGYWNTDSESFFHSAISNSGLGCSRFQQIQRYFKVSSVDEEDAMDMKGEDWFRKVDSFFTRFRKKAHEALVPGRDIVIDELLVQAEGRSLHTFQILNKAAGKGYKVYALCVLGYLFDFVFTSRTEKIAEIEDVRGERLTTIMIK